MRTMDSHRALDEAVYVELEWAIPSEVAEVIARARAVLDSLEILRAFPGVGTDVVALDAALEAIAPRPTCPTCGHRVTTMSYESTPTRATGPSEICVMVPRLARILLGPCNHPLEEGSGYVLASITTTSGERVTRQGTLDEATAALG